MSATRASLAKLPSKVPVGIIGFDAMTGGGLPRGRTTLVLGGPGSGKTILAMKFLVHGAQHCKEPGIFVAFEETSKRIIANAEGFGWNLAALCKTRLYLMDAQPAPDLIQAGDFDLSGLLAALEMQIKQMRAKRIVFDALDVVLALLPDAAARRREVYRLHEWLLARELTGIITSKLEGRGATSTGMASYDFLQFMVDCAVILNHGVVQGVSQRNLRVTKYRGSSFDENESPFIIGISGMELAFVQPHGLGNSAVTTERVSSGVQRLDTMLGGGYYRRASVLITGSPGTAKTTLCAAFAEAACRRGERTLFVSFDSDGTELIRNQASVGIRLERHVKNGRLRMVSARAITGSAETYLARIKALAGEHGARCMIIDPISALSRSGNESTAHSVGERLLDWAKADSITLICTSLLDEIFGQTERDATLQLSTLADTWIHLSHRVQAGERNRGLSIIKSRGTAHSNQVRELILSNKGVTLADTYTSGGEVLMGTLRWEKERTDREARDVQDVAAKLKRVRLDAEEAELEVRVKSLKVELLAKQVEKELLARTAESHAGDLSQGRARLRELRGADAANPVQE